MFGNKCDKPQQSFMLLKPTAMPRVFSKFHHPCTPLLTFSWNFLEQFLSEDFFIWIVCVTFAK